MSSKLYSYGPFSFFPVLIFSRLSLTCCSVTIADVFIAGTFGKQSDESGPMVTGQANIAIRYLKADFK